jgi:hypothetical protein
MKNYLIICNGVMWRIKAADVEQRYDCDGRLTAIQIIGSNNVVAGILSGAQLVAIEVDVFDPPLADAPAPITMPAGGVAH